MSETPAIAQLRRPPRIWRRRAILAALLAGFASCSSLNPLTLARMARMDPLTVPPGDVAVRLSLPEGLEVPASGAVMTMTLTRKSSGTVLSQSFALIRTGNVWKLAPADASRLSAMQAEARSWRDDDREGRFEMRIAGCRIGDGPAPGAAINADISFDAGQTFAPLMRNLAARDVLAMAASGEAAAPGNCPAP